MCTCASSRLITVEELAEQLHTTPDTIYYWRSRKRGPAATRVGKRILFRQSTVDEWAAEHTERRRAA